VSITKAKDWPVAAGNAQFTRSTRHDYQRLWRRMTHNSLVSRHLPKRAANIHQAIDLRDSSRMVDGNEYASWICDWGQPPKFRRGEWHRRCQQVSGDGR